MSAGIERKHIKRPFPLELYILSGCNWSSLGHVSLPVGQSGQRETTHPVAFDQLESPFPELGSGNWAGTSVPTTGWRGLCSVPDWSAHTHRSHQDQQIWWLLRTKQCGFSLKKCCAVCPAPPACLLHPHIPTGGEAEATATQLVCC